MLKISSCLRISARAACPLVFALGLAAATPATAASAAESFGQIKSPSGECIDANSVGYGTPGDLVRLHICDTAGEQEWYFKIEPDTTQGHIINMNGQCLSAGSTDYAHNGDMIQLEPCNDGIEQIWGAGGGVGFQMQQTQDLPSTNPKCLEADSSDYPNNDDPLVLWACNLSDEEAFSLPPHGA